MLSLPEIEIITKADFDRLFSARQPVVVRGLAASWPLMHRWFPAALVERMGDFRCTIARDSRPAFSEEVTTLKRYFAEFAHLSTMTFIDLDEDPADDPVFLEDVPLPNPLFARPEMDATFFYHANRDGGSLPHCHMDAVNILQSGRKRWVLYDADPELSPSGAERLKACHRAYGPGTHARDWFADALEGLADSGLTVYEGVQEAGDAVYIPARFAHGVLNLTDVMGLVAILKRRDSTYTREADGRYSLHADTPSDR